MAPLVQRVELALLAHCGTSLVEVGNTNAGIAIAGGFCQPTISTPSFQLPAAVVSFLFKIKQPFSSVAWPTSRGLLLTYSQA